MDDSQEVFVIFLVLVVIGFIVGGDLMGNFALGMISALVTLAVRRKVSTDAKSLVASVSLGIALFPFFAYLLWYAAIGKNTIPASTATDFLSGYVTNNFLQTLPSTIVGSLGEWVIDSLDRGV